MPRPNPALEALKRAVAKAIADGAPVLTEQPSVDALRRVIAERTASKIVDLWWMQAVLDTGSTSKFHVIADIVEAMLKEENLPNA